ncbi:hypothetical protein LCGC14_0424600 [marine sediment metagenome]|uniref:Bacteriophage tail tape measure N-terminal domain-containing protein n=1 Tax=marine sediment metagenome TaxID=412755 RepID=A0A0F9VZ48_9ZZZZ
MATAVIGTMAIKLIAQTDKFDKDLKKAGGKLKAVGAAAKKVAAASAGALAAIAGAAVIAIRAADQQRQAELKLAAALQASGQAVNLQVFRDMADSLQDATGQGDELTLSQAALLTSFGANQKAIAALLPGIADYAAATGKNATKATQNLGRAIQGEFSLLKTMGIGLSDAETATFKLANQTQRAAIIAEKLGTSFGGTAEALSKTAVGAFARVQGRIGDLIQEFGFMIDTPVAGFFLKIEGLIKRVTGFFAGLSKQTKQNAVRFGILGTGIIAVAGAIAGLIALAPLIAIIALPFIKIVAVITLVTLAIAGMRVAWKKDLGGIRTGVLSFIDIVISSFEKLKNKILEITDAMSETFATFIAFIKGESADEAFARVQAVRTARAEGGLGAATGAALGGAGEAISGAAQTVIGGAKAGLGALKQFGGEIAKEIKDGMDPFLKALGIDIDTVGDKIKTPLGTGAKAAGESLKKTAVAAEKAATTLQGAIEGVVIEAIAGFVADMGEGAANAANAMLAAFSVIGPAVQKGGKEMSDAFSGATKGFEQGGPVGAAVGALAALATSTEAFRQIMESVNTLFVAVKDVLQRILEPLVPLIAAISEIALLAFEIFQQLVAFGTVMEVLKVVMQIVVPVVRFVNSVAKKIFDAFKALGAIFGDGFKKLVRFKEVMEFFGEQLSKVAGVFIRVINKITSKWNEMIEKIARALGKIPGVGGKIKKFVRRAKIGSIEAAAEQAVDPPGGGPGLADVLPRAIEGLETLGEAARTVTAQLTNVPKGFKIALRRFQASAGEQLSPELGGSAGGMTVFVQANDAEEIATKLKEIESGRASGSFRANQAPGGDFQTPRGGS